MPPKKIREPRKSKIERQQKADDRFTWRVLGVMLFLTVWTFLLYRFNWPAYIYVIPVGVAVLYLLAYIYPRDFTVLAVFVSGGAFGLWLLTELTHRPFRLLVAHILFGAVLAFSAFLFWLLRKNKGILSLARRKLRVIPNRARYRYLFIACAALALALAASALFGGPAAWFGLAVMFSYLFVMAVYYTVKMI
jgi:hypothetical protein